MTRTLSIVINPIVKISYQKSSIIYLTEKNQYCAKLKNKNFVDPANFAIHLPVHLTVYNLNEIFYLNTVSCICG
jgi:hypothetical protein